MIQKRRTGRIGFNHSSGMPVLFLEWVTEGTDLAGNLVQMGTPKWREASPEDADTVALAWNSEPERYSSELDRLAEATAGAYLTEPLQAPQPAGDYADDGAGEPEPFGDASDPRLPDLSDYDDISAILEPIAPDAPEENGLPPLSATTRHALDGAMFLIGHIELAPSSTPLAFGDPGVDEVQEITNVEIIGPDDARAADAAILHQEADHEDLRRRLVLGEKL